MTILVSGNLSRVRYTTTRPVLSGTGVANSVEVQSGASFTITNAGSLSINGYTSVPVGFDPITTGFYNGGTVVNGGQLVLGGSTTANVGQIGLANYVNASFSNVGGARFRLTDRPPSA